MGKGHGRAAYKSGRGQSSGHCWFEVLLHLHGLVVLIKFNDAFRNHQNSAVPDAFRKGTHFKTLRARGSHSRSRQRLGNPKEGVKE
jgi:hypothetical protein